MRKLKGTLNRNFFILEDAENCTLPKTHSYKGSERDKIGTEIWFSFIFLNFFGNRMECIVTWGMLLLKVLNSRVYVWTAVELLKVCITTWTEVFVGLTVFAIFPICECFVFLCVCITVVFFYCSVFLENKGLWFLFECF